jgi:hypothetical protein
MENFERAIIDPAIKKNIELRLAKARVLDAISSEKFLDKDSE